MEISSIHFYVDNATAWRNWFVYYLGFSAVSSEISSSHTCTEMVQSGAVCFLLSSPLLPTSPVAEFLRQHPPGVADITFTVQDVETAIAQAAAQGATILEPIQQYTGCKCGKIAAWGGMTHTLIEKKADEKREVRNRPIFTTIDHIVLNVPVGDLEPAVAWYKNVLDLQPQQTFKIKTDRSALYSQVLVSHNRSVQLPINEPASSNSQIQEFLDVNRGAGIQHIALRTSNLISAIAQLRSRGLSLLSVPQTYYSQLKKRPEFPLSPLELDAIAQQEILVDWQVNSQNALLLQIFTQPIFEQPTFFFEFIERRFQAQGFGEGNFRALFEAIESEQIKRGTLQ
ncbi:4-hydroxyphenylpyruvate dioxygenase [Fortiea sp. LEGE XX443]|uniref:4-hydroxyphenylpyruvate dioxygenase n=1 Tax=Fortiea sp. LEGE XX443 TaxID=1828611 RepID=UPI001882784A|nr:4-hydroxyphenylpyruvate dioxygenase [Fortiea sp. LEGE XX443]MBE9007496.1 4-hydroxyphenylpyruvate dioxygenase [Fortiea sp. LEGE XX443]